MMGKIGHVLWIAGVASAASCPNTYDYIVVGGGTAGVAVATRLSQGLSSASVLLIEAGPTALDELKINVPGMKGSTLGGPYDWNFTTVAQPDAENRTFSYNRGKVLGGSSALNLMTYNRAVSVEYDAWGELGNDGWSWDTMLAAMQKSENYVGPAMDGMGSGGPVAATIDRVIPSHQDSWIPTLNSMGVVSNNDSLGGDSIGVMYQPSSIDSTGSHYNRSFSAAAYQPLQGSNLVILDRTTVAKVTLQPGDNGTQKATGVQLSDGTTIRARREVILSAGAVQSPGLLELSGIGNQTVVEAAGLELVIDLPAVGENLQDHLRIQTSYQLQENYTSFDIFKFNTTYAAEQLALWEAGEPSHYDYAGSAYTLLPWSQVLDSADAMLALARAVSTANTSVITAKKIELMANDKVPEIEVIMSDGYTGVKGYPSSSSSLYGKFFFTLIAVVQHPLALGSIHINASDPTGKPVINPNYLTNDYDRAAMALAAKFNRAVAQTAPLRDVWINEYEPGLDAVQTDADWDQFALDTTLSIYHPSGTCAMLPQADGGVVDSRLRVYGTSNLRVVDASIIPLLFSGHLQTAVYGIAELAAEMIIEDAQ